MKRTIMAAMVLSLAAGSLAFADPPHDRDRDHHEDRHQMVEHHSMRDEHEHRGFMMSGRYVRPHGYHHHYWRRGERLPPAYRASEYVIPDPVV